MTEPQPATAPLQEVQPSAAVSRLGRIYISGPMSDLPQSNFPAFHAEAARLRAMGHQVVNPAELNPAGDPGPDAPDHVKKAFWKRCLRVDLKALMDCDTIALLDGWENSSGAHLELHNAHRVGIRVVLAKEISA